MSTVRWIGNVTGNRKWMIVVLSLIQGLLAGSGSVFALLMRNASDSAFEGNGRIFTVSAALLGVLIVGQIGLRLFNRYLEEDTKASIENRFRRKVFRSVLENDYRKMTAYHTGELMNRIISDTSVVTDVVVTLIPNMVSMVLKIIGVLVVLYTIEPWFTFIFLVGGCLMASFSLLPRKWLKRNHKRVQEADGVVKSFLQECLESLLVIHAFGKEEQMEESSRRRMQEHRRMRRRRMAVTNVCNLGLSVAVQCGYYLGFAWCGYGILHGTITYGTLTAVLQLVGQIQTPFANIGGAFPKFTGMLASAERLMELTDDGQADRKKSTLDRTKIYEEMKSICFDRVSFCYDDDDRWVLKDDTFVIEKGEFVAFIGSSGIGKSTIMKLLLSVIHPAEGEIFFQMREGKLPVGELPSGLFAYVPQGNHLMSGTIEEVVAFTDNKDEIDTERLVWACRTACAEEFIEELPNRYQTILGEKGSGLSEGQMQRLAVARAIYSECPILLLDEATSALDPDTERRLIGAIKALPDRTVLLVTHRKDVWELCDRIYTLKEKETDDV